MRKFSILLILVVSLSSCRKDGIGDCCGGSTTLYPNMDLIDMKALYAGKQVEVNGSVIIAGRVTANDISGNFHRTFIIEDETAAIEVRAGLYDLKNLFPEGRYVAVKAAGLWVTDMNGVLQIGLEPPEGFSQVDYFEHRAVMDKYVVRGELQEKILPHSTTIDQLEEDMCGSLVCIQGLALKEGELDTWASQYDFSNYSVRTFRTADGWEIGVSTSKYASFAGNTIPTGTVALTGILLKDTHYMLRLRTLEDVAGN